MIKKQIYRWNVYSRAFIFVKGDNFMDLNLAVKESAQDFGIGLGDISVGKVVAKTYCEYDGWMVISFPIPANITHPDYEECGDKFDFYW